MGYSAKPQFALLVERAGLTHADLAKRVSISRFFLSHLARNRRNASGAVASRIAGVYAAMANISQDEALERLFMAVSTKKGVENRQRDENGRFVKNKSERTHEATANL